MADKKDRRGLGRGLSALMSDVTPVAAPDAGATPPPADHMIAIDQISANPDQPRRVFDRDALADLAASIAEQGIIQPLILRPDPAAPNRYQIVAGERRWRAAQIAKLHEVPAIVREFDDLQVLEVAIIENIQRADLNPVEEAAGYKQLVDRFGHTQEKMAEALGKSRSYIANAMRLLSLPSEVLDMVSDGRLSAGHARALITAEDPLALAREVVAKALSVRQTEKLAKGSAAAKKAGSVTHSAKDADTKMLEQDLMAVLRMRVSIDHPSGQESGAITIRYKSLEQLDDLCRRITAEV
ncbi:MAG: ParB/RepB/Spo0J family partition protein [Pseudomonadota bacterium]